MEAGEEKPSSDIVGPQGVLTTDINDPYFEDSKTIQNQTTQASVNGGGSPISQYEIDEGCDLKLNEFKDHKTVRMRYL